MSTTAPLLTLLLVVAIYLLASQSPLLASSTSLERRFDASQDYRSSGCTRKKSWLVFTCVGDLLVHDWEKTNASVHDLAAKKPQKEKQSHGVAITIIQQNTENETTLLNCLLSYSFLSNSNTVGLPIATILQSILFR